MSLGRKKIIDKGPRNIDLDILYHGDSSYQDPRLQIPHAAISEREFVLRPLAEYMFHLFVDAYFANSIQISPFKIHKPEQSLEDRSRRSQCSTNVLAINHSHTTGS
jgi:hypothetical protein